MKRHRTDVVSLLFGLLFLALAGWWAVAYYLDWTVNWNVPNFGWFAAGVLIVLGLLGVAASLRRDRTEPALAEGPAPTSAAGYVSTVQPSEEPPTIADAGPTTADLGPIDSAAIDVPRDDRPRDDTPRDDRY